MTSAAVIATVLGYIAVLFAVAWVSGRRADNAGFFSGNRRTPWYMAAFAMIGAAMSGVTFISVPGSVAVDGFSYMQMVAGFTVGQLIVAFVLIPTFYRLKVVSLYEYLDDRFGVRSHRTGAWFFFVSKMLGAALRIYVVCAVMQLLVFSHYGLPFWLNAAVTMLFVWLYTQQGGVKSLIWTDTLKTVCLNDRLDIEVPLQFILQFQKHLCTAFKETVLPLRLLHRELALCNADPEHKAVRRLLKPFLKSFRSKVLDKFIRILIWPQIHNSGIDASFPQDRDRTERRTDTCLITVVVHTMNCI